MEPLSHARSAYKDPMLWSFLLAALLMFWVPELIIFMEWADFWIIFLTEVFIWSLFAVAFNLLMGYGGLISFGQAAYLGLGGYTAGLLLKYLPWMPFYGGLVLAPVGAGIAALIIGYFCIRRTHIYFAILTLAFGHIVYLIAFKWYDFTGGDNGLIGVPVPEWIMDPTFANYYKFVLVVCLAAIYLLWRIVNSPFGKTLTAIRENEVRADFIGVDVQRVKLYAFTIAGAFSGLAGALIMVNERSVYPDLAHWTQSAQVLLMSLLGGVYTFFGPIVGAFLLQTLDADITQNYPEIWQLFLGAILVLILFGLPGGIVGFIQQRDINADDDHATRMTKLMAQFIRKSWYFFIGAMVFTAFFTILQAPDSWLISEDWDFELLSLITWGIAPRTVLQIVVGTAVLWWLLRGIRPYAQLYRWLLLAFTVLSLILHMYLETPLSGLGIVFLWVIFSFYALFQPDMRQAFSNGVPAAVEDAAQEAAE
jgi:branched-chain amino acid transport system permease protein